MQILALDTSTEACSVALWIDGEIHALHEICPRDHTQRILPLVQQVLALAGSSLHSLDAIAFGRGPGSFTGVRIGISIAQGLALGADLPMIPVSTLKTLAQGVWRRIGCCNVLAAIDARMGEVYSGVFHRQDSGDWIETLPEMVISPVNLQKQYEQLQGTWATAGTGWQTYPELAVEKRIKLINSAICLPEAQDMLPLALQNLAKDSGLLVEQAEPIYLRNQVAWNKLPGH